MKKADASEWLSMRASRVHSRVSPINETRSVEYWSVNSPETLQPAISSINIRDKFTDSCATATIDRIESGTIFLCLCCSSFFPLFTQPRGKQDERMAVQIITRRNVNKWTRAFPRFYFRDLKSARRRRALQIRSAATD